MCDVFCRWWSIQTCVSDLLVQWPTLFFGYACQVPLLAV
jgi:hypothetical protein